MPRAPLLSVIVPVHNVAPYLRRCMDSILHDNRSDDVEVIAVDDASTDASPMILSTYAGDPGVRIHTLHTNRGLAAARTTGLGLARGRHVAFVDSDDWLTRGALRAIGDRLRRSRDHVLFFGHTRVTSRSEVRIGSSDALRRLGSVGTFSLRDRPEALRLFHVAWNKVYDRRFLLDSGLRFADGYYEDITVAYPILMLADRIGVLDRVCYCYRERPGAITSTPGPRHAEIFARYEDVFAFLDARRHLDRYRATMFERMITHELGVLPRVGPYGSIDHRRFFSGISAHHHRYRPPGHRPRVGIHAVKDRLVRDDAYRSFHGLMSAYRHVGRLPARIGGFPRRRTGSAPQLVTTAMPQPSPGV